MSTVVHIDSVRARKQCSHLYALLAQLESNIDRVAYLMVEPEFAIATAQKQGLTLKKSDMDAYTMLREQWNLYTKQYMALEQELIEWEKLA